MQNVTGQQMGAVYRSLQNKEEKSLGGVMLPSVKRVEEECEAIILVQYM